MTSPTIPPGFELEREKSITKAQIQELADRNKVSYAEAEKKFKEAGYEVE